MARPAATIRSGIGAAARRCGRPACPTRIGPWPRANATTTSAHSAAAWPPTPYWVNDIEAREQARLKVPQLIAASACGLAIPETLFSNDPEEIRRFYAEHRRQGVIFKLNVQTYWANPSGVSHVLFTTALRDEDLSDDEALSSCPAIYQRKIEKAYELRVTCMDERCFTVRLDSQSRDMTRMDWRADLCAPVKPRLHELPHQVEERCIMLMRKLGLAFGCIDLIVTPQGEHVFLEVNEMGQFLWVEQDEPGCPMLRAFATLLIQHRLDRSAPARRQRPHLLRSVSRIREHGSVPVPTTTRIIPAMTRCGR